MQLRILLVMLGFFGFAQSRLPGQTTDEPAPSGFNLKHLDGQKLVFVVNGAGDSTSISDGLNRLNDEMCLGLKMQMVQWCLSTGPLGDYKNYTQHLLAARRLAGWTLLIRKECPNAQIYYVGHSTGTRIVLSAAEMLPEKSIERVVLIATAVGSTYDLRPALRSTRNGIDNFWSAEDGLLEGVAERWGLADGSKGQPAGCVGFRCPPWIDAEGSKSYQNVRQYRWNPSLPGGGGHFTWSSNTNLRTFVVPLLCQPAETRLVRTDARK